MDKPFSQACENNKGPILEVLREHLESPGRLLEIGSGTGQHAAWLAPRLPHIRWQPSDLPDALPGISRWLTEAEGGDIARPLPLDVRGRWPDGAYHYLFTANTFHIMATEAVARCIEAGAAHLRPGGLFLIYGPFRYEGEYTSESNRHFDLHLRQRNPDSGIRDHEWIVAQMARHGLALSRDHDMPANNRILVFRRDA